MTWQTGLILAGLALVALWLGWEAYRARGMRRRARKRMALDRYTSAVDAQWDAYQRWVKEQRCRGCGAKHDTPGKLPDGAWWTETWCGCAQGRDAPDNRPAWSDFGRTVK